MTLAPACTSPGSTVMVDSVAWVLGHSLRETTPSSGARCSAARHNQTASWRPAAESAASNRLATSVAIAVGVAANPITSPVIRGVPG
jgi:hypothetical protein